MGQKALASPSVSCSTEATTAFLSARIFSRSTSMLSEGLSCAVATTPIMRQARRLPVTMRPRDAHLMGRTLLSTFGIVVSFPGTMGAACPHRQQDYYEAAGNVPWDSPGGERTRQGDYGSDRDVGGDTTLNARPIE